MDSQSDDLILFQEAFKCLEMIAVSVENDYSGYSTPNGIFNHYDRCAILINTLRERHDNPYIASSLESLLESLAMQQRLLKEPIELRIHSNPSTLQNQGSDGNRSCDVSDMLVPSSALDGKSLDDVVGLEDVKQVLNEAFIMPVQYPHLFTGALKPWKRILMYGPPGTGKTKLAMAVAAQLDCPLYSVSMANVLSSWMGESEKNLRELFVEARQREERAILFFDEIDSICRTRSSKEDESTRRIKTELLRLLDGGCEEDKLFILAATNCPWDLDKAFLRRFQKRIYVPLPNRSSRQILIQKSVGDKLGNMSYSDWEQILDLTEGYSGADITHLIAEVSFLPIRELQTSRFWKFTSNNKIMPCSSDSLGSMQLNLSKIPPSQVVPRSIELKDFLLAAKSITPTESSNSIDRFKNFS